MTLLDKTNKMKNEGKINHHRCDMYSSNESNVSTQYIKQSRKKRTKDKENIKMNYDFDKCTHKSCTSLHKSERKFFKSSREHKGATNKIRTTRYYQHSDSESMKQNYTTAGTFRRRIKETRSRKDRTVTHFKSEIDKVTEDLKTMFCKFTTQIDQSQSKYIPKDVLTLHNAGDAIFILNCIISKLKEELTEKQQILTNAYTRWSMLHKFRNIPASTPYKRFNNNDNMAAQSEVLSDSSITDFEMFARNTDQECSHKVTKNSKEKDRRNIENMLKQKNIVNDEGGSSSDTTDRFFSSSERACRDTSHSNNNVFISLDKLPEINLIRLPPKSSTVNNKVLEKSVVNVETSNENIVEISASPVNKTHTTAKNQPIMVVEYITDDDSDIDSSCSTMVLYPEIPINFCPSEEQKENLLQEADANLHNASALKFGNNIESNVQGVLNTGENPLRQPSNMNCSPLVTENLVYKRGQTRLEYSTSDTDSVSPEHSRETNLHSKL